MTKKWMIKKWGSGLPADAVRLCVELGDFTMQEVQ